jgi:hypothetical protein
MRPTWRVQHRETPMISMADLIKDVATLRHAWEQTVDSPDVVSTKEWAKGVLYGIILVQKMIQKATGWQIYKPGRGR